MHGLFDDTTRINGVGIRILPLTPLSACHLDMPIIATMLEYPEWLREFSDIKGARPVTKKPCQQCLIDYCYSTTGTLQPPGSGMQWPGNFVSWSCTRLSSRIPQPMDRPHAEILYNGLKVSLLFTILSLAFSLEPEDLAMARQQHIMNCKYCYC